MNDILKNYKHIIWDWNGTLFNDVDLCVNIINNILIKRELEALTLDKYRNIFRFPVKDYYRDAGLDFDTQSFEVLGKEWMDEYEIRKAECFLFPDVKKVLEYIDSIGIEQSVLSAYSQHTLEEIIDKLEIKKYFKHIKGLDNIYAESKMELGQELMREIGTHEDVVLIGDTLHDFDVAKELKIECILVSNGHQSKEQLTASGCLVINSLNNLLEIL
ncbi:MAG: HAD family hydrolase [Syntrophothermus sp.]